ncbi:F-box protein At1g11270-like [Lolium perenne]|uniref:F-box protein At1g11270-like n=1 Tax=Lolium perenne TaxID=4522 RepID=UPI0021F5E45E|nr:F-box protein At5g62510-like [Lolium perenne]
MASTRRCPLLPDEIISDEILPRLPAKSVLGLRCLSRAWAATLSSDHYIDRYHALHGGRPKIFRIQNESHGEVDEEAKSCAPPPIAVFPMAVTIDWFPRCVTVFWDETTPPAPGPEHPSLAATRCRGLVLLELVPTGIHFVCNPSTGKTRALPEGRTTGCRSPRELSHKYASLGLGYDAPTRRHKVVRVYYRGSDSEGRPASMGCEVYVVNARDEDDSAAGSWRPVTSRPAGWVEPCRPSVFAQGQVYWLGYRKHDLRRGYFRRQEKIMIISFSMSQETFGTVSPPAAMDDEALRMRCLRELGGELCLFSGGSSGHEHRYDVWLLHSTTWDLYCRIEAGMASPEVNRVMRSHRNIYNINILPLAITDNGRRILLARNDSPKDVWVYTPLTGDIQKHLDLDSVVDRKNWLLEVAVYEENVASPGRQLSRDIVLTSSLSTQALSLVLRLLPERTLRRLMCVCRSWCTMIAIHLWYVGQGDLE